VRRCFVLRAECWAIELLATGTAGYRMSKVTVLVESLLCFKSFETFLAAELMDQRLVVIPNRLSIECEEAEFALERVGCPIVGFLINSTCECLRTFDTFEGVLRIMMLLEGCLSPEKAIALLAFMDVDG
jgi:hypothetical protein